jgi:hypothetical protein
MMRSVFWASPHREGADEAREQGLGHEEALRGFSAALSGGLIRGVFRAQIANFFVDPC